jgi:hypothetical protein
LADNKDLLKKFVSYLTANLSDLSINLAREYVIETLTSGFSSLDWKEMLAQVYGLSDNPSRSTIWAGW